MKRLLTIAGSDSGGGAGIQADLKTFHQHGCYGMSVLTAITAQNTRGVHGVENLSPEFVVLQLQSVVLDIGVDGAKTGMLSTAPIIRALAQEMRELKIPNLVVDPVMRSKGGASLLREEAQQAFSEEMVPLAELITPNLPEAAILAGIPVTTKSDMREAAVLIHEMGARRVLIKGGHLPEEATDILYDGKEYTEFFGERILSRNTHGTGCTYSAAIAANLAMGHEVKAAIRLAKQFTREAIKQSIALGQGIGPLNHFVASHIGGKEIP
ncbi:MAG: bifunctional hydroxymethylpyrimidine kinase/phosphomethylpyrimidine kinase [bacterium]